MASQTMSLRMTDRRERRLDNLVDATGEGSKAGAIDAAASHYLRMRGGTPAVPNGQLEELLSLAISQGSVTPKQIADVLDTDELPIQYDHEWSVGDG